MKPGALKQICACADAGPTSRARTCSGDGAGKTNPTHGTRASAAAGTQRGGTTAKHRLRSWAAGVAGPGQRGRDWGSYGRQRRPSAASKPRGRTTRQARTQGERPPAERRKHRPHGGRRANQGKGAAIGDPGAPPLTRPGIRRRGWPLFGGGRPHKGAVTRRLRRVGTNSRSPCVAVGLLGPASPLGFDRWGTTNQNRFHLAG